MSEPTITAELLTCFDKPKAVEVIQRRIDVPIHRALKNWARKSLTRNVMRWLGEKAIQELGDELTAEISKEL